MSSLDNIIEEIIKNAQLEAKEIIDKATIESENVKEKAKIEANKESEKIIEKAKLEGQQSKERILSNSKIVARDKILVAKQKVIDKVIEDVKEKLKNIDHDLYLKYVENTIKSLSIKKDSEILLTEKEKEIVGENLFGIKVSNETVESGFSLKNGKVLFNNDFSSIVEASKEDLEREISKMLFS